MARDRARDRTEGDRAATSLEANSQIHKESSEESSDTEISTPLWDLVQSERRPGRFRRWTLRPFFWCVAGICMAIFAFKLWLDSPHARQLIATEVGERLGERLQRPVEVRDLEIDLLPLSVQIWGFVVGGPEGFETPFLEVPWAEVDLDLQALQGGEIRLRQVRVERPRIFLQYLESGRHNLLRLRRDKPRPRRFDIFIDRLEVDQADFYLDRQTVRLSVSADAMRARLRGLGEMHLAGQVIAQNVRLSLPGAKALSASLAADVEIHRGRLEIVSARIGGPGLTSRANGHCTWSRDLGKSCEIATEVSTDGQMLTALGYFKALQGPVELTGKVGWRPGSFGWTGEVRSPHLEIWDRQLNDVAGLIKADRHSVRLGLTQASYGGGTLAGTIAYQHGASREERSMEVDLDFQDIGVDRLMADQRIPVEGMAARLAGRVVYRFPFHAGDRGDGFGEVRVQNDVTGIGIPLAGAFPITIEKGIVSSESIQLTSAHQSALSSGWYDVATRRGRFDYEVVSADLRELLGLLPVARDSAGVVLSDAEWPEWLPTAGSGRLEGNLALDGKDLETDVTWRLTQVLGKSVSTPHQMNGRLRYDGERLDPLRVELADATGALRISGRVPVGDEGILVLGFDAADWPLGTTVPWLPFEAPLDGRLSGRFDLRVDAEGSTGELRGRVRPATLWGVPLDEVVGDLEWNAERLRLDRLRFRTAAGEAWGHGSLRWEDRVLDLRLSSGDLEIAEAPLATFLPHPDLAGRATVEVSFQGDLVRPSMELEVEADGLTLAGLRLGTRPSRLRLSWADGQLDASGRLVDVIGLRGGGALGDGVADLAFDLRSADLAGLLELVGGTLPVDLMGSFAGQLRVAGKLPSPAVELELPSLEAAWAGHQLRALEPVRVAMSRDGLAIESLYLVEPPTAPGSGRGDPGSELFLTGNVGWNVSDPIDLKLEASLSTRWLEIALPSLRVDGTFDLLGHLGGRLDKPLLEGQGRLRDATVRLLGEGGEFPYRLEDLGGNLLFDPGSVILDRIDAQFAGGRLRLAGRVNLPDLASDPEVSLAESLDYRLQLDGEDLRLRYPAGWRLEGGAELALRSTGSAGGALLSGRAHLDRIEFVEDIPVGFEQLMQRFLRQQRLEMGQAVPTLSAFGLNVIVDATDALVVRNNLAELRGGADLVLRGTLAQPVLFGSVTARPGGVLVYNGAEYVLERGRVRFSDPSALNPEVDLAASTQVRDFAINLQLSGTLENLDARFSSDPPLPDVDVFRILASGGELDPDLSPRRPLEQLENEEQNAAATFLYGQAASVIGSRVGDLFRFDTFRIDPLTGSGDNLSSARLTVGKRLSKDFFLSYSTDPSSTEDQRFQLEWRVSPSLTLVLTQNGDDSYEADARWETSF